MTLRHLCTGPQYPDLETAAFDRLVSVVSDAPRSLLYIARNDHTERQTRDRWCEHGAPLSLSMETFDSFVSDCYEHDQSVGTNTYIDQPLRDRIAEQAVELLEDPSNPLAMPGRAPSAGLCRQVEDLLSLVEFADLHTPDAIRERFEREGLYMQAETVSSVAAAFETARAEIVTSGRQTLRAERYHHVLTHETSLAEFLPFVDAVVLGGFRLFSPLERRLVEQIAETWPTIAVLPQITDSTEPVGVDQGVERALYVYSNLGFEREYVTGEETPGLSVARQLYRPARLDMEIDTRGLDASLTVRQPESIPQELRHVAREIRSRVGAGTSPDEFGVVLTNPSEYHERLVETFDQYDVPATLAIERSFGDTALGEIVSELASLGRDEPLLTSLTTLLSNPLVTTIGDEAAIDHSVLARLTNRLTSRRLSTALDHLDDTLATAIQSLIVDIRALRDVPLAEFPEHVETLLDQIGVLDAIDALPKTPRSRIERAAMNRLKRTLDTLALTDSIADLDQSDPVDRLERALTGITLDAQTSREDGHVLVCGLNEAATHEFKHTYVLGLTMGHFPSNPERLAFTRPINEAHQDFEQADIQQGARYDFALLLASEASLTLSVPERSLAGDPYIEADVLTELHRVSEIAPDPIAPPDTPPGSREDVQRSLAVAFAHDEVDEYTPSIERAANAGTFDAAQRDRLHYGTACAAARASTTLTPYDGQLSAETVATLHGQPSREPHSPSRLETYAKCGYKYYMARALGIDEPDEIGLEPDARERGGFVHDVIEHYYAALQAAAGEAVPILGDREARESHLLDIALKSLEESFDDSPTAFQREWLTKVFAGLGSPERNPYYGNDLYGTPERGLFVRLLDHEFGEVSKATALPTWFEARVGNPYGDETVLQEEPVQVDTPLGTVLLTGMIDRIDTVPNTQPTQLVVRDYKTGRTPSEAETLSGLAFQLPLYALLIEGVLDDVETVGGAYYQVKPPRSVSQRKGLIGSQEHASYVYSDTVDTPLLRYSKPAFESHGEFRQFIEQVVPERLGQLVNGITSGRFHPTILDPKSAGCRYCGYRDICDVRPHRRRDVIDEIEEIGSIAYVPLAARDAAPADVLEVE